MRCVKAANGEFAFQISVLEKQLLFDLLRQYPLIPASYQPLTRSEARKEDQQLLEESLAAHRARNRDAVVRMLKSKSRFRENKNGFRFSLGAGQIDWLLQVLNDIRVGCWIQIGSPESPVAFLEVLNEQTAPFFWGYELSGRFQMLFLGALEIASAPGDGPKTEN